MAVVFVLCVLAVAGSIVYPPWEKVSGEFFYFIKVSEHVREFAGFDFLTSAEKRVVITNGNRRTYFQICWPVMLLEWAVVGSIAGIDLIVQSRRLWLRREA